MTEHENDSIHGTRLNAVADQITDLLNGTPGIVTEYYCTYHVDRAATSVCETCKADLCSDCSHVRNHRLICSKCMGGLDRAFAGTGIASPFARLLTHPFAVAFVIAGLLGIALFRLGSHHRMGLLGRTPGNIVEAQKQSQLRLLLFARKAHRIETHGEALNELTRYEDAAREFQRAKSIYVSLIDETNGRWEQALFMLARARLLQKTGHDDYARGLYENVAAMPGLEETPPVIAQFHLGKLTEKDDPEEALESHRKVLSRIRLIPANRRAAINLTAGAEKPYNYETRLHQFTGNALNFNDLEDEAEIRMGVIYAYLGHQDAARYRFSRAVEARNPELAKWASRELQKLGAIEAESEQAVESSKGTEEKEEIVITHY